jgi:hypothetical protein
VTRVTSVEGRVARSIIPPHELPRYLGSIEPTGGEHASYAPSLKPSTVGGVPDALQPASMRTIATRHISRRIPMSPMIRGSLRDLDGP